MNNYTIYCTPEQTKKALELGAPIKSRSYRFEDHSKDFFAEEGKGYFIPTAEQMIGWLEEQGLRISIYGHSNYISQLFDNSVEKHFKVFYSRKEATLAAIDAALDYLDKNMNNE